MALNAPPRPNSWSTKLVSKIGNTFRSDKSYTQASIDKKNKKLQKKNPQQQLRQVPEVNELGEHEYAIFAENRRPPRPKAQDNGEIMHSLARTGSFDSFNEEEKPHDPYSSDTKRKRRGYMVSKVHEQRVANLPDEIWKRVTVFLSPIDACNLALSTKTLYRKLGLLPFNNLNLPENKHHKIAFLYQYDERYPQHLLCFPCGKYHLRLAPGKEVLKMDYVSNPLFNCPKVKESVLPRTRLTYGRELPYAFVQLVLRASNYSPSYGIDPAILARKWKCKDSGWLHTTRYMVHDGRLLMRVVSQRFAPPAKELSETGERHILYDREEYTPFFSVCAHWRDGDLMKICKSNLSARHGSIRTDSKQANACYHIFQRHQIPTTSKYNEALSSAKQPRTPISSCEAAMNVDPQDDVQSVRQNIW